MFTKYTFMHNKCRFILPSKHNDKDAEWFCKICIFFPKNLSSTTTQFNINNSIDFETIHKYFFYTNNDNQTPAKCDTFARAINLGSTCDKNSI